MKAQLQWHLWFPDSTLQLPHHPLLSEQMQFTVQQVDYPLAAVA
jgi:hypothetical protein